MNVRRTAGVMVVLLAAAGWWWISAEPSPEPVPEPRIVEQAPPPRAPPPAVLEEPAPPIVIAELSDAGVEEDSQEAHSTRTHYLSEGNRPGTVAVSAHPFQVACRREAEACATNELFWSETPSMVSFTLTRSGDRAVVLGLGPGSIGGSQRFLACLERAMKAIPLEGIAPRETRRMCMLRELRQALNDPGLLAGDVGKCLGPRTPVKSVTLKWELVAAGAQVEVQELEVTAEGELDGYTRRCIEQAASPPPRRFTEESRPPFTRRRMELTVMTFSEGGPSNQPSHPGLGERFKPPKPRPSLGDGG